MQQQYQDYDLIIAGGGFAGCIVATRTEKWIGDGSVTRT